MKTVPLHGVLAAGRVALVDDADFDLVMQHRWNCYQAVVSGGRVQGPYAITKAARNPRTTIRMHKLLTGWPETDHKNHNGLDNQRNNLRPSSGPQNHHNQRKGPNPTSSRFKGVTWYRHHGCWRAQTKVSQQTVFLGYFASEVDAALAYDAAARQTFGEFAALNFPGPGEIGCLADVPVPELAAASQPSLLDLETAS